MTLRRSELIYEADQNYIHATFFADQTPDTMPVPADVPGCDSTWKFTPDIWVWCHSALTSKYDDGLWATFKSLIISVCF